MKVLIFLACALLAAGTAAAQTLGLSGAAGQKATLTAAGLAALPGSSSPTAKPARPSRTTARFGW